MDVASDDANGPENPGQWKTHPLYHTNFTNDKDGSPHAEEMLGAAHERRGLPYIQATKHRDEGAPVKQLFGLFGLLGILATLAPAAVPGDVVPLPAHSSPAYLCPGGSGQAKVPELSAVPPIHPWLPRRLPNPSPRTGFHAHRAEQRHYHRR